MGLYRGSEVIGNSAGGIFVGEFPTLLALQTAFPTANAGDYGHVNPGVGQDVEQYLWDTDDNAWVQGGGVGGVVSVNGDAGPSVTLDADDISDASTGNKFATANQLAKVDFLTVTSAKDLDQMATDLSNTVRLTGNQTVNGTKTLSSVVLSGLITSLTNATTTLRRLAAGATSLIVEGNGASNTGSISAKNANHAQSILTLLAASASAQINVGGNYPTLIINGTGIDVDTIIRGANNDNLFVADAGLDAIGIGGAPNANAILDLQSTTKAFLPPRMTTTQRNALTAVQGMVIFNTTINKHEGYNGATWHPLYYGMTSGQLRIIGLNGVVTPLVQGVPTKLLTGGLDVGVALRGVTKPADNRLQVNELETADFKVTVAIGIDKTGGGNDDFDFHIYMDGAPLATNPIDVRHGRFVEDIVSFFGIIPDVPAGPHYFEIWVTNLTSANNCTWYDGAVSVERTF